MERTPVRSKAIVAVGYRGTTLEIEFTGGRVYRYFDVPARVHEELMAADSHGRFFNEHVRERFSYEHI
jgi:KTSC domain-containing protein